MSAAPTRRRSRPSSLPVLDQIRDRGYEMMASRQRPPAGVFNLSAPVRSSDGKDDRALFYPLYHPRHQHACRARHHPHDRALLATCEKLSQLAGSTVGSSAVNFYLNEEFLRERI